MHLCIYLLYFPHEDPIYYGFFPYVYIQHQKWYVDSIKMENSIERSMEMCQFNILGCVFNGTDYFCLSECTPHAGSVDVCFYAR